MNIDSAREGTNVDVCHFACNIFDISAAQLEADASGWWDVRGRVLMMDNRSWDAGWEDLPKTQYKLMRGLHYIKLDFRERQQVVTTYAHMRVDDWVLAHAN